jgi:lipopolysaccharide/colanic/teichoic acid biosynthesis glycosyltransferase
VLPVSARRRLERRIKRLVDIAVAGSGLVLAAPTIAVISVAIRRSMGSPVLFRQIRPGLHGKPFEVIKFRTMTDDTGPDGRPLPEAERMTRFGYVLRRTSLDELPQLWTILKGDMSLVGPRPLLMSYLEHYTPEQARRHDVPPGLTGWAQVHGRVLLDFDERFRLDTWYVDHWSLSLDLRIALLTVRKVLRGEGLPAKDHVYTWFGEAPTTPGVEDARVAAALDRSPGRDSLS